MAGPTVTRSRPRAAPPPVPEPKPERCSMLVRMDEDLAEEIRQAAVEDDRSIAATIRVAIRQFLNARDPLLDA